MSRSTSSMDRDVDATKGEGAEAANADEVDGETEAEAAGEVAEVLGSEGGLAGLLRDDGGSPGRRARARPVRLGAAEQRIAVSGFADRDIAVYDRDMAV